MWSRTRSEGSGFRLSRTHRGSQGSDLLCPHTNHVHSKRYPSKYGILLLPVLSGPVCGQSRLTIQTIGFDKINQLRHVKFLKDIDGVKAHMAKHAAIIRPKFEMILDRFEEELKGLGAGSWIRPNGGYFITFKANEGCAKNIVAKAKEAGVVLTGAGAPYPYKKDPKDSVIRIAPTLPPMEELKEACEVFIVCAKLASVEKLLEA